MSYYDCDICGEAGTEIRLAGGFLVNLCIAHRNEWGEYARGLTVWQEYRLLEAERGATTMAGDSQKTVAITKGILDAEVLLFRHAQAWVAAQKVSATEGTVEGDTI